MAEDTTNTNGETGPVDLSGLGSFDFTPAWARGDASDTSKFKRFEAREERDPRRDDRPKGEGRRPSGEGRKPFGERNPFGERRQSDEGRKPFRDRGAGERRQGGPRNGNRPQRPFVKPMEVDVRILPNQKELGPVIRKIQTSHLAYPLKNLAYFFLEHPEACVLRVSPKKDASAEIPMFHQCKTCGWISFDSDSLLSHVVSAHMGDYYSSEEIECEPPKGVFTCVAKCGLSGELLGPPNLHGYDARIREMLRTRYPGMSESEYRARIVTVRDADAIEEWRKSAVKKTIYRLKKAPAPADAADGVTESPALEREIAEAEFRRNLAPALMSVTRTVDIAADIALKCQDCAFVFACRDALAKERRFPASLFYALRGAFHHRKLVFFRANDPRGPEFVTAAALSPLDCEHAVPELAEIVRYVEAHPDATRASFRPEQLTNLSWLIEKGHLVGYFNGTLAVPSDHPVYRNPSQQQKGKRSGEGEKEKSGEGEKVEPAPVETPVESTPAESPVESASVETAPAAETPVPVEAPAAEAPAETDVPPVAVAPETATVTP